MLEKTIILDGKNKIKRVVAFNNIKNNEKIYLMTMKRILLSWKERVK
ncbi:hypothetical protein [Cetobacterium somerae]